MKHLLLIAFFATSFQAMAIDHDEFEIVPFEQDTKALKENFVLSPEEDEWDESRGFPSGLKTTAYDPINKKKYDKVIIGPTYRNYKIFTDYHYWRYITVYSPIQKKFQRIASWPIIREECHDGSSYTGGWSESISYSVEVTTSAGFEKLGLSASIQASIGKTRRYEIRRAITATSGIEADHVPYISNEDWIGVTYIQVYNKDDGMIGYIKPHRLKAWFNTYPLPFRLTNQNYKIRVQRENKRKCDSGSYSDEPRLDEPLRF